MRDARVLGICFIVIGALFVADGAFPAPIRWLRVGMGVMLVIAGVLYLMRGRPAAPPAA